MNIEARDKEFFIPDVINLEALYRDLDKINRVNVPIFLNPENATWKQVAEHAKTRQNLSNSTIEKHLRTARFMELHICPVDFKNLNVENVIRHFDYRITFEEASRDALRHERDAVYMFLRAFKLFKKEWREYLILPKKIGGQKEPLVLFPKTLNELYHAKYGKTVYEDVLFQTIVFTIANIGMRPPSEIINLDLENVVINKESNGYIWIIEDKKNGIERQYIPFDKKILSSKVYRTIGNYLKTWRPKVANEKSGNALFLQPDGKRITGKFLRDHIVGVGKKITCDKRFKLYTLRHTFATYYYDWTKDLKKVARRLGHSKTDSVDFYVNIANDLNKQIGSKSNLFNQALRQKRLFGGKHEKRDSKPKKTLFQKFFPVRRYGPAEI